MKALGFSIQKNGNEPEENEDAFAFNNNCFAVSDGATCGSFSQNWSKILAPSFVQWPHLDCLEEWLKPLQEAWHKSIDWNSPAMKRKFIREKAEQGGFATLTGLTINGLSYQVMAIGDSCFFQIRKKQIIKAFPIDNFKNFGNSPELICSNSENNSTPKVMRGDYQVGDILILVTDALAQWILSSNESINKLLKIKNQTSFDKLIIGFRKKQRIKNDDATIILIRS